MFEVSCLCYYVSHICWTLAHQHWSYQHHDIGESKHILVFMRTSSQDSEYVKIADEAWQEALEIARSTEDWKEEKNNKDTVSAK